MCTCTPVVPTHAMICVVLCLHIQCCTTCVFVEPCLIARIATLCPCIPYLLIPEGSVVLHHKKTQFYGELWSHSIHILLHIKALHIKKDLNY